MLSLLTILTIVRREIIMPQSHQSRVSWLILFFILAALPALACTTFLGSGEDEGDSVAVQPTIVVEAEATVPAEAPTEEPAVATEAPTTAPTEEPTPVQEEGAEAAGESGLRSLESIFQAQRSGLAVDALRMTMINEDLESGEAFSSTFEFIKPDRFHMASEGFEIIIVEDTTYMRDESGTWIESPIAMGDMFEGTIDAFTDEAAVEELLQDLEVTIDNVQSLGQETVNGKTTDVYEYTAASLFDESIVYNKIWVGADDGLLYQQQIETESEGVRGRTTITYEYGSEVVIEAPIP
jgi:hypothetical protein